jgi:hypothetical protein
LRYSDPEMLDQCVVWDFVGLPQEYPGKAALFETVQSSMEAAGILLPDGNSGQVSRRDRLTCVLDRIGPVTAVMQRSSVRVPSESAIEFSGWAVHRDGGSLAPAVEIDIDGTSHRAEYGGSRGDIAAYFNNERLRESGFSLTLPAAALSQGPHTVTVHVICGDSSRYEGARVDFVVE